MPALDALTKQIDSSHDLSPGQVEEAASALASAEIGDDSKAAFLLALSTKGETAAEVAAFAAAFRARAIDPGLGEWAASAIDVVGTGGDHAGSFNVSSLVVLVLACAGVKVMKHGNRGITSKCGSADLMAAFGVDLEASPVMLRKAMAELGFVYLFAPAYHPAFRQIAPVRRSLAANGRRTVFNILGPLVNPGRPGRILLGVYSAAWLPRLAAAAEALGSEAGLVVHGAIDSERGIDELTTATRNAVRGIGRLRSVQADWTAADFKLAPAPLSELKGSDLASNLALTEAVLSGRGPAGLVDSIAANASVALWICGRTKAPADAVEESRSLLVGGAVRRKLDATREFYRSK